MVHSQMRRNGLNFVYGKHLINNLGVQQAQARPVETFPAVHFSALGVVDECICFVYNRVAKNFLNDINEKPERYFRILNEVPTVLMLLIVILVVVKPF